MNDRKKYQFYLGENEEKKFEEWKNAIKLIYGEYGQFTFSFTPTGIGTAIEVFSSLADKSIELTDYESW